MIARLIGLVLLLLAVAAPAAADVFKPAYLELRQTGPETYDVLWKQPALDEATTIGVTPVFPDGTSQLTSPQTSFAASSATLRWRAHVPGGLEGKAIRFDQLDQTGIEVLVRLERADGSSQVERVLTTQSEVEFKASPGPLEVVQTYSMLGIEHILLGFDHLCFVLALVLIVRGTRRLIWTVTAFTLAHSITLALATLEVVQVPGPPVEATIALSIIFVANEIVQQRRGREGLASKRPWLVAFAFGLLHGLGFAGALAEIGLPANAIPLALLFFNVGVEIGQLLFIGAVLLAMQLLSKLAEGRTEMRHAAVVAAYAIGGIASYWVIERISSFWR